MYDFIFDGEQLSDYGYIVCSYNNSDSDTPIIISNMTYTEIKNPISNTSHKTAIDYEENLSKKIQIMKKTCNGIDDSYITDEDIESLSRWLCRRDYKWLLDVEKDVMYEAKFNISKILINNICQMLELNITTNRSYGVTSEKKINISFVSDIPQTINVASDKEGYIYPSMIITPLSSGDLIITNESENRNTIINNCIADEKIIITGGDVLQIETDNVDHNLSEDFNYVFLRFYSKYKNNLNSIKTSIDCNIEFTYRCIRMVGL